MVLVFKLNNIVWSANQDTTSIIWIPFTRYVFLIDGVGSKLGFHRILKE